MKWWNNKHLKARLKINKNTLINYNTIMIFSCFDQFMDIFNCTYIFFTFKIQTLNINALILTTNVYLGI